MTNEEKAERTIPLARIEVLLREYEREIERHGPDAAESRVYLRVCTHLQNAIAPEAER